LRVSSSPTGITTARILRWATAAGRLGATAFELAGRHSLLFSGTGDVDRVKIPLDAPARPVDVGGDFTIEFWLRALPGNTGTATAGNIIFDRDIWGAGDYGDWGIALGGGRVAFGVNNGSAGSTVLGTALVTNGAWQHVACTRRASDGQLRIFVNGQLDATATGPSDGVRQPLTRWTTNTPFNVGAPAITSVVVATGISAPTEITHAGDGSGRLFLAQQNSLIKILDGGTNVLATPFLDLSSLLVFSFEQGC